MDLRPCSILRDSTICKKYDNFIRKLCSLVVFSTVPFRVGVLMCWTDTFLLIYRLSLCDLCRNMYPFSRSHITS